MVGKSSFVLNTYIMNAYEQCKKRDFKTDLKILYYSLEVERNEVISKMVSWKLYDEDMTLCSPNTILSKGRHTIPPKIEGRVEGLDDYFTDFFKRVKIIDRPLRPTDIKEDIIEFAKKRGTFYNDNGRQCYKPNNDNEHVIVIFDTLGNLKLENVSGQVSTKSTIDYHSGLCRDLYRNILNYSVVDVTHSNRSHTSVDRMRYSEVFPQKSDIKDSSKPSDNANVVIALFNPLDYANKNNDMFNFMGYKLGEMDSRYRAAGILKNRNGITNVRKGLIYLYECGGFRELKPSRDMTDKDYTVIKNLKLSVIDGTTN
jgi:hypothetical protein